LASLEALEDPSAGKREYQLVKLIGGRAAAAVIGLFMLGLGSSEAGAQSLAPNLNVPAAVRALDVDQGSRTLGVATQASLTSAVLSTVAKPAQTVTASLPASINAEAAWLYKAGWPLYALVDRYSTGAALNQEANCIATAVYFEARGEALEGQLAVARVIMNRAASGQYPASWCSVVTQPSQFSFVRHGQMPAPNYSSDAWRKAQGVTRLAMANVIPTLSDDVLWYHANYVNPSWGHRLSMAQKIGQHIFYR
jgi:spore germination cell wall hydrolase CwlJ-like protein